MVEVPKKELTKNNVVDVDHVNMKLMEGVIVDEEKFSPVESNLKVEEAVIEKPPAILMSPSVSKSSLEKTGQNVVLESRIIPKGRIITLASVSGSKRTSEEDEKIYSKNIKTRGNGQDVECSNGGKEIIELLSGEGSKLLNSFCHKESASEVLDEEDMKI